MTHKQLPPPAHEVILGSEIQCCRGDGLGDLLAQRCRQASSLIASRLMAMDSEDLIRCQVVIRVEVKPAEESGK